MKKAFWIFAALMLLLAAGCEKQEQKESTPPPPPTAFTAKLDVAFNGTAMTAELKQISAEEYEIQILTPEILNSLNLRYTDGICTVTYDGLKFETDLSRFPQAEFGALLTQTLTDVIQGINIQKTYSDGTWTYHGTGERGSFALTANGETGAWLSLSIDGAELKADFSEFTVL